jgi:hypothetical protein
MRSANFIIADGVLRHQERQAEAARWRGAAAQPDAQGQRRVRIWGDFGRRVGARYQVVRTVCDHVAPPHHRDPIAKRFGDHADGRRGWAERGRTAA